MITNEFQDSIEELEPQDDPSMVSCMTYVVVIFLVAGVVVVILAVLGPAVGNVFSNIVSGI